MYFMILSIFSCYIQDPNAPDPNIYYRLERCFL